MKQKMLSTTLLLVSVILINVSCQKGTDQIAEREEAPAADFLEKKNRPSPAYNLNVNLSGDCNMRGHLKFRQDPDPEKIIELDIKVHHLLPNHEYLLQRAVDAINVVDGNCTSTTWLTLGKGLVPQSIFTDEHGKGSELLWRDVSTVPSGSAFDIHFQVIDAVSLAVVLTSDCYQYQVR